MKAFFDTNVYVNTFFRPLLPREEFQKYFEIFEIVIHPIVQHELLLGVKSKKVKRELDHFFRECEILEAPSRTTWEEATRLMNRLGWKENRQQNDVLLALGAQENSATVISYDTHFERLPSLIPFNLILLREK